MKAELLKFLKELGFKKLTHPFYVQYILDKEVIVLPKGKLSQHHIINVRKHLDMKGHLSAQDFDKRFLSTNEGRFTKDELSFIETALNAYWNESYWKLQKDDLGDIEKQNYEYALKEAEKLMKKIQKL